MGCLHQRDQQRCPDRPDPRDLAQQFPRLVLLALNQHIPPHFLAQGPQGIEWRVVVSGAPGGAGFVVLAKPFRAVAWCVDLSAATGDGPTSIQRLEPGSAEGSDD